MKKTPIALIIDDAAPRVFVYYEHSITKKTADGRPLLTEVPNSFLDSFCDTVERYGIRGKFSVVPMPGGRGSLDTAVTGFPKAEIDEWMSTVKTRLSPYFAFCPEMLTHAGAVDLETGAILDEDERVWAAKQDRTALTPYIEKAVRILANVGIKVCGVTSPWDFGEPVEDEYVQAIAEAMDRVHGVKDSWYFCRSLIGVPNAKPWIALNEGGRRVVSIPGTVDDGFWKMMDTTDTSAEYVRAVADSYLTEDGKSGRIVEVLESGGWPILTTHWQSQFSNGAGTGLKALTLVAKRVEETLSDRVEWTRHDDMMKMVLEEE